MRERARVAAVVWPDEARPIKAYYLHNLHPAGPRVLQKCLFRCARVIPRV
jgi:hypothetical protein